MALYKPGVLAQAISGSIGSGTFVNGRGGSYLKSRGQKCTSGSIGQVSNRGKFPKVIRAWAALSDDQQLQWNTLGARIYKTDRVGTVKHYRGRDLFASENLYRVRVGLDLLDDAPPEGVRWNFFGWSAEWSAGALVLRANRELGVGTGTALFYGCRAHSGGGFSAKNFVLFLRSDFSSDIALDATSYFIAHFGEAQIGELVAVRIVALFDGFLSGFPQDQKFKRTS